MQILGKILNGLLIIMLIAIGGLFLVSLMPIPGNVEIKIVKSGSMEPAIQTGSLVVVMPQEYYKVKEVITFGEDNAREIPTTHRIIGVRSEPGGSFYITKGDANEEADPTEVATRDIIGKVMFHVPGAGYVLDFARQPLGFALLIGLPALMIIIEETFNIFKEIGNMRRRRRGKEEETNVEEVREMRTRVPTI